MSQERPWYQDGGNVLCLFVVFAIGMPFAISFYNQYQKDRLPLVFPPMSAQIQHSFLGSPSLVVHVWHQHPGNLQKGQIAISIPDEIGAVPDESLRRHSFEVWPPNEENAVTFKFPLKEFHPDQDIPVTLRFFDGGNYRGSERTSVWRGFGWKSSQDEE